MTPNYDALCFGFMFVIGCLFLMAWMGMSGSQHYTTRRPPDHPPGWENIQIAKQQKTKKKVGK